MKLKKDTKQNNDVDPAIFIISSAIKNIREGINVDLNVITLGYTVENFTENELNLYKKFIRTLSTQELDILIDALHYYSAQKTNRTNTL